MAARKRQRTGREAGRERGSLSSARGHGRGAGRAEQSLAIDLGNSDLTRWFSSPSLTTATGRSRNSAACPTHPYAFTHSLRIFLSFFSLDPATRPFLFFILFSSFFFYSLNFFSFYPFTHHFYLFSWIFYFVLVFFSICFFPLCLLTNSTRANSRRVHCVKLVRRCALSPTQCWKKKKKIRDAVHGYPTSSLWSAAF